MHHIITYHILYHIIYYITSHYITFYLILFHFISDISLSWGWVRANVRLIRPCLQDSGRKNKHLMIVLERKRAVKFPRIPVFPDTKSRETSGLKGIKSRCSSKERDKNFSIVPRVRVFRKWVESRRKVTTVVGMKSECESRLQQLWISPWYKYNMWTRVTDCSWTTLFSCGEDEEKRAWQRDCRWWSRL